MQVMRMHIRPAKAVEPSWASLGPGASPYWPRRLDLPHGPPQRVVSWSCGGARRGR